MNKKPVTAIIVGAGHRSMIYASLADKAPQDLRIVGVADPNPHRRRMVMEKYGFSEDMCFTSAAELASKEKLADAIINGTMDNQHVETSIPLLERGYDVLLEKPFALNEEDALRLAACAKKNNRKVMICHVLRYAPFYYGIKERVARGDIGEIVNIQQVEHVSYHHMSVGYVRGKWANSKECQSSMLLSKSCHDMDILNFLVGRKCLQISSFGSLKFFKKANQPAGAADRCMECKFADECTYSAKTFYFNRLRSGAHHWPLDVITNDMTEAGVTAALKNGPYGRCVFACDNDVVDNQVLNFLYEDGITGTMTMTAFSNEVCRQSEFRGTLGEITGDGHSIKVTRFGEAESTIYDVNAAGQSLAGGHGGGDNGLMNDFVRAVAENDQSLLGATPDEMLAGHFMAFEAEKSRTAR